MRNQPSRPHRVPRWDTECRELWLGDQLIKDFRQPARNQQMLLTSFQEQGWCRRIDDPLPPDGGKQDPKRRLNDTIKNLNRHHKCRVIRFFGDGTGQGIRWRLLP